MNGRSLYEERRKEVATTAVKYEVTHGTQDFLKACLSSINRALVKKGVLTEDELREALVEEISSTPAVSRASPEVGGVGRGGGGLSAGTGVYVLPCGSKVYVIGFAVIGIDGDSNDRTEVIYYDENGVLRCGPAAGFVGTMVKKVDVHRFSLEEIFRGC